VRSSDHVEAIRREAAALLDGAATAGLDAPVPSCPDWDVAELLAHIGRVHRFAAACSERTPDDGPSTWPIEIPERADRLEWVREGADRLAAAVDRAAEEPAWTWISPNTVGFWQRRQAHETAMHRVDAQLAAGSVQPIAPDLAADGIDEWFDIVAHTPFHDPPTGDGETLHFHCTDVTGEWLLRLTPDGLEVEREHAKGDVAARGTASDLLCWLQGRGPVDVLDVFGDGALLSRWRELARF
jgi:uncharacterized protein (TIGR03083 family)